MNTFPISEKLRSWLNSLPSSVPLRAVSSESSTPEGVRLKEIIADSGLPSDSLVTAMLWLRLGIIEPAHEIVQNGSTPLASYLHGVVHRLEGDYWNAKYWFRQVQDKQMLQLISSTFVKGVEEEGLSEMAVSLKVMQRAAFSPAEFVSLHEHLYNQTKPTSQHIEATKRMAWIEWTSLWKLV